jgi:hypothetical protein
MAEYDEDNIKFIRALVKISSALYDIDEMKNSKKFKYALKKDVSEWHEWSEEYIKEPMSVFGNTDADALMTLIQIFDDYSDKIYIKDEFNTRLNLFLAKISSARLDLIQLEFDNKSRMSLLIKNIETLTGKGYFKSYTDYVDPYGKGFTDIVESMNKAGNTIIVGTKENNL